MKLILTNVTYSNLNAIKALVLVATNLVPTAMRYTPDSEEARYTKGYQALRKAFYDVPEAKARGILNFAPSNPFEQGSPEAIGYNDALKHLKKDTLTCIEAPVRWRLEATGNSPADTNLLIRFAHTLGKTYRNVDVTIED